MTTPRRAIPAILLFLCTALVAATALPTRLHAEPDEKASAEIEHLLKFVSKSDATFIRNGDSHTVSEAVKHIKAKRDHYIKKISTAEDFVRLAATKSALSGRKYQVKLSDGKTRENAEWLLEELERYRKAREEE